MSRAEVIRQAISYYLEKKKSLVGAGEAFRPLEGSQARWSGVSGAGALRMVSALIDTNILIGYLNGIEQAKIELKRYSDKAISVITWMEVMVAATPETERILRRFLNGFDTLPIEESVSEVAVILRKKHNIKLPDAIVWATAQAKNAYWLLVTRRIFLSMKRTYVSLDLAVISGAGVAIREFF